MRLRTLRRANQMKWARRAVQARSAAMAPSRLQGCTKAKFQDSFLANTKVSRCTMSVVRAMASIAGFADAPDGSVNPTDALTRTHVDKYFDHMEKRIAYSRTAYKPTTINVYTRSLARACLLLLDPDAAGHLVHHIRFVGKRIAESAGRGR